MNTGKIEYSPNFVSDKAPLKSKITLPDAAALDAIEKFVTRVNARAEQEMLETGNIAGAHHRAIEAELALLRKR